MAGNHWTAHEVLFRAEAPIHVGWHELGLIQRTRYFIPARAMWGVLVSGIAASLPGQGSDKYENAKKVVAKSVRTTCFFPLYPGNDGYPGPYIPHYAGASGLYYGPLPAREFEARFVSSSTSAAIIPDSLTAEDGALHESEFLAPHGCPGQTLHFQGYVLLNSGVGMDDIESVLAFPKIGADRRYGWGRLRRIRSLKAVETLFDTFRILVTDDSEDPVLQLQGPAPGSRIPAHLECQETEDAIEGELEVLVGRDWIESGSGQRLTKPRLCWCPGSRIKADVTRAPTRFAVRDEGTWYPLLR